MIRLYVAIHVGLHWKIQDRGQIINTDITKTKHKHFVSKQRQSKQHKTQQNKTTRIQSLLTTLSQDTSWACSTMLPTPHETHA